MQGSKVRLDPVTGLDVKRQSASHAARMRRVALPPPLTANATEFREVLHYNIPWTCPSYPSRALWQRGVLSRPVTRTAFSQWMTGRARPPSWAVADLLALMEGRAETARAIVERLRALLVRRLAAEVVRAKERNPSGRWR